MLLLLSTLICDSTMDKLTFQYSMKNIPIPTDKDYMKRLIEKTEEFLKRLRWRAFFFLNPKPDDNESKSQKFGFKTQKSAPAVPELKAFEGDMAKMIEDIKFQKVHSTLQKELSKDKERIKKEKNIIVPADKTSNYYTIKKETYQKMMQDNVTTTYKRAKPEDENMINNNAKVITNKLKISDRVQVLAPKPAYVTLKDHKNNFRTNPKCRLINPCKTEVGRISKQLLERINGEVREKTNSNQWINSTAVIDWFNKVEKNERTTFISFDVVNFYPSISKTLLQKALNFARKYTTITQDDEDIIVQAKATLLYHENQPWKKTSADDLFDVTMGSFDGAETCELVGLYILEQVEDILPKANIGLYRDDGLAVINKPPRAAESIKKKLCEKFKQLDLEITSEANLRVTDFLDITFDLNRNEYRPYSKPGDRTMYVHAESNHPRTITKKITQSIQTRLSNISSSKEIFIEAKPKYEEALNKAGHKDKLNYNPTQKANDERKRNRKRKITWYNPPYSKHVKTNVGKTFLQLIDKNFPKDHPLHKICNRNTIKISYSCMPNMKNIIQNHNNSIGFKNTNTKELKCNCKKGKKKDCPLPGKCTVESVIYCAKVETPTQVKSYIGQTSGKFKIRYAQHNLSFKTDMYQTALSKFIKKCDRENIEHNITWEIIRQAQPYSPTTKKCNLCIWEKYFILTNKRDLLNSRSELVSTCRHKSKFFLEQYG